MRHPSASIAKVSKYPCFFVLPHQFYLLGDHLACKLTQKCLISQIRKWENVGLAASDTRTHTAKSWYAIMSVFVQWLQPL